MKYLVSIEDSIKRILETPKGTRVMLPEFGSDLYKLIDKRPDDDWVLQMTTFIHEAITRWETRIQVKKIEPDMKDDKAHIKIEYQDKATGKVELLEVLI